MKKIPQLVSIMTPFPYTIDRDENLVIAKKMMQEHGIRHLPVSSEGELVGMISDRDIKWALDPVFDLGSAAETRVGAICEKDFYSAEISEPIDKVIGEMSKRHIGSVIATKNGKIAGILTTVDVCSSFVEFLHKDFAKANASPDIA